MMELMPPQPLANFEIQKYYQNEPRFNGVYSRNNLSKIKDGAYLTNLNESKSIGTHCIALYVNDDVTYFESFTVEHILKEIEQKCHKKIIFKIQVYDSRMCWYFCVGLIDFMLTDKSLLENTNLFSPNEYEKILNNKTKTFSIDSKKVKMEKIYCIVCGKYRKTKKF